MQLKSFKLVFPIILVYGMGKHFNNKLNSEHQFYFNYERRQLISEKNLKIENSTEMKNKHC